MAGSMGRPQLAFQLMSAEDLIRDFNGLRLLSGKAVYVGIGSATDAVEWFRRRSLVILGMDGFKTNGIVIQALEEYIADFSDVSGSPDERSAASAEAAIQILGLWGRGPEFVDFVVEEPS
jgi:hypothetical protein